MSTRAAVPRRPGTGAALIAALLVLSLAAGCPAPDPQLPLRAPDGGLPNVLLVTVDALRPDHLGAYGSPVPTSPTIDLLATAGVRISEAIATSPETAPAVASLLTGLYQYRSQVLFDGGSLVADVPTLAERLRAAGYYTAAVVGTAVLSAEHGFDRGFEHFETFGDGSARTARDAEGVDAAAAWLDGGPAHPWFLWVHLVAPHGPYTTADPSWSAPFEYPPYMFGADADLVPGPSDFGLGILPKYQRIGGLTRPSELIRRYDGEIRYTDAQIGRLLEAVAAASGGSKPLTIVTGAHGESLTEHRELFQHGWFLYDATLRVPLVLVWPNVLPAGRVVERQVSGVDLVPTLAELLGLPAGDAHSDGTSFALQLLVENDQPAHAAFAIGPRENRQTAMRWAGWKMVHTPAGRPPVPLGRIPAGKLDTPERWELYNLVNDPGEVVNLVHKHERVRTTMQRALARFRRTLRAPAAAH